MTPGRVVLRFLSLGIVGFLYVPIAVLIVFSWNDSRLAASWTGFTGKWYAALLHDEALLSATRTSVLVAGISTIGAVALGVMAALGFERCTWRHSRILEGLMLVPLIVPEIMMGVALLSLFALIRWPLGLTTVVAGHITFNLPLVMAVVRAKLRQIDQRIIEAAQDLGASSRQTFWWVTWPLIRPAVLGSALLSFTVSLDDFIVTFFTTGPGGTTLPLKVYSMIKSGVSPEINALSALLLIISMGLIWLALIFHHGEDRP